MSSVPTKQIRSKINRIVFTIIVLSISVVTYLRFFASSHSEMTSMVDALSSQSVMIHKMVKDANVKYQLLEQMQTSENLEFESLILERTRSLEQGRIRFDQSLRQMMSGVVLTPQGDIDVKRVVKKNEALINHMWELWTQASSNILYLSLQEDLSEDFRAALFEVNLENYELALVLDELSDTIRTEKKNSLLLFEMIAGVSFISIVIYLLLNLRNFYVYVIEPINAVYLSLKQRGLLRNNETIMNKDEVDDLLGSFQAGFSRLDKVLDLINQLNRNVSFEENLIYIFDNFKPLIPFEHLSIAILTDNDEMLELRYALSDKSLSHLPSKMIGLRQAIDQTTLNSVVKSKKVRVIHDLIEHTSGRPMSPYNQLLLQSGIRSSIALPLVANELPIGIIFFSNTVPHSYTQEHIDFLTTLADSISLSFYQKIYVDDVLFSGIRAIAKLAEARDSDTGDHLNRMKKYSRFIAEKLFELDEYKGYITPGYIRDLESFAPIHDIGKVGISDELLLFKGRYSDEQREDMKKHVEFGSAVLHEAAFSMAIHGKKQLFDMPIHIVTYHHEKWDGSGYPKGLKGEEIPLSARIVSVADVLDALLSKRVYKDAIPFEETIKILVNLSGKEFDPKIIDIIIQNQEELLTLYQHLMETENLK